MPVGRPETTVGVIGLGAMGDPIARRLLAAGFPVRVTSRGDRLRPAFEAAGATWCDTAADVQPATRFDRRRHRGWTSPTS